MALTSFKQKLVYFSTTKLAHGSRILIANQVFLASIWCIALDWIGIMFKQQNKYRVSFAIIFDQERMTNVTTELRLSGILLLTPIPKVV